MTLEERAVGNGAQQGWNNVCGCQKALTLGRL